MRVKRRYIITCQNNNPEKKRRKLIIGISAGTICAVLLSLLLISGWLLPQFARVTRSSSGLSDELLSVIPDKIVSLTIYSAMCSEDLHVRYSAFQRAGDCKKTVSVHLFQKGLTSENSTVKKRFIIGLPDVLDWEDKRTELIPILVSCLRKEEQRNIILRLIDSLTLFGKEALPYLDVIDVKVEGFETGYRRNIYNKIIGRVKPREKKYIQFILEYMLSLDRSYIFYENEARLSYHALRLYYKDLYNEEEPFGLDFEKWAEWWEEEKKKDMYK